MVKVLTAAQKHSIAEAIAEAERATSAEIVAVISPASDAYMSYLLLYGLALGSAAATGLWAAKIIVAFPLLLAIQLGLSALLTLTPPLRKACAGFVPKRIRHHRAAHRAFEEYLMVSRHLAASVPIVLFYVSLAERYAHILTSRDVREKIQDATWNAVIDSFTESVAREGLQDASAQAIRRMGQLLAPHFPSGAEANRFPDIIERSH
jgi:putative membrane protein